MTSAPQRVVCLSAESADWLWRLGAWDQVVGVTAFFEPPADAAPKSRVSGFSSANRGAIIWLQPDLVVTFSDVQAALTTELIQAGLSVLATNQRTLAEIESTLALLARAVGRESEGERLLCEFRRKLAPVPFPTARPRVYFEEWNDPLITGIAWVSELIERAGGEDIFADVRNERSAAGRVVSPEQVLARCPNIILASWCGKPVDVDAIAARARWESLAAVQGRLIREIPGADILQPGFRLVAGYDRLKRLITEVQ